MGKRIAVIIDENARSLESLKSAIKVLDSSLFCVGFVNADEAVEVVTEELKHLPHYIFIEADMNNKSGTQCLQEFRNQDAFKDCTIVIFSITMPPAVAGVFKQMGANFAFQKPLSDMEYNSILKPILK